MLSETDKRIINELQSGLSICSRPYELIAGKLNISEEEVIDRIEKLIENGSIRKLGAVLNHRKAGYNANAMVVWVVPDNRVQEAGNILASFKEVSHCYQRPAFPGWPFNLFTMVHGDTREACDETICKMAEAANIHEYRTLYSIVEFKKTSTSYFTNTKGI